MKLDIKRHFDIAKCDFMLTKTIVLHFSPLVSTLVDLANNGIICQRSCNKYTRIRL